MTDTACEVRVAGSDNVGRTGRTGKWHDKAESVKETREERKGNDSCLVQAKLGEASGISQVK